MNGGHRLPKTKKKHFKIFKKAVKHYLCKFHVSGWNVYYRHEGMATDLADVWADIDTRAATFRLSKRWSASRKLNAKQLRKIAKHEVVHLILWPMYSAGWSRFDVSENRLKRVNERTTQHISDLL